MCLALREASLPYPKTPARHVITRRGRAVAATSAASWALCSRITPVLTSDLRLAGPVHILRIKRNSPHGACHAELPADQRIGQA